MGPMTGLLPESGAKIVKKRQLQMFGQFFCLISLFFA